VVVVVVTLFGVTPPASGASDSLTLSTQPAQPTDAGFAVVVTGLVNESQGFISVHYRKAGTGTCGSSPIVDSAFGISPDQTVVGTGPFDLTGTSTQLPLGSYELCAWLVDPSDGTVVYATATQVNISVTAADTVSLPAPSGVVEGRPFNIKATGNAYDTNGTQLDATYKRAGGSCASTPAADSGTSLVSGLGTATGAYTATVGSQVVLDHGSYLLCAWLSDSQTGQVLAQNSATVSVRALSARVAMRVPAAVDAGSYFRISVTATLDAGVQVFAVADVLGNRGGAACASTPSAEPTSAVRAVDANLTDTQEPVGSVTASSSPGRLQAGRYLVCVWLVNGWDNSGNRPTVAGPISATIAVMPPLTFRGRTSQKRSISFTVAQISKQILQVSYTDHFSCAATPYFAGGELWNGYWSSSFDTRTFGVLTPGRSGWFSMRLNGNVNHTFDMTARLANGSIRGRFSEQGKVYAFTYNSREHFGCRTGTVRFSART
jgi:hypothetical protein